MFSLINRLVELSIDRGMSWEMAMTRFENHKGPNDGFYISRREMWGRKLCILATQKENSSHLFRISRLVLVKYYSLYPPYLKHYTT